MGLCKYQAEGQRFHKTFYWARKPRVQEKCPQAPLAGTLKNTQGKVWKPASDSMVRSSTLQHMHDIKNSISDQYFPPWWMNLDTPNLRDPTGTDTELDFCSGK